MLNELIDKLTNNFTEAIFCKKENTLEKQIEALKVLLEQYPNNESLKKELKLCEIGLKGEKQIEYELKNSNIGMYVLHDVNLVYGDLKAQIDYIVVTPAYNYFIECKNLYGSIVVDFQGNFNREFYYRNRKIKEGMPSPLSQAQRHVEIYKKIWNENNTNLISQLFKKRNFDTWNKSLVVMANSKNILNLQDAPEACREKVIKSDCLVDYIKNDMKKYNKELFWKQNTMYEFTKNILLKYNQEIKEDYIAKYKEKFNLEESLANKEELYQKLEFENVVLENNVDANNVKREILKNRLIEFRKTRSKEKGIPAYYVFNNAELEAILDLMPKTLEELQESKVLQRIKVLSHGKEIIDILSKN